MFTLWLFVVVIITSSTPGGGPPFAETQLSEWAGSREQCLDRLAEVVAHPKAQVKAHGGAPTAINDVVVFPDWQCRPIPFVKD